LQTGEGREVKKRKHESTPDDLTTVAPDPHISSPVELAECFTQFFDAIEVKRGAARGEIVIDSGHDGWYPPNGRRMNVALSYEQVQALREMYRNLKRAFRQYGERLRGEGKKEGTQLLVLLAKGEVTISDFDASAEGQ
jgi:hypothetical protein